MRIKLNWQDIAKTIKDEGYEVYIVGGYVRDKLLKKESLDVDLTTNAKPTTLQSIFHDQEIDLVGNNFAVTIINGVEVATYRKDIYNMKNEFEEVKFAKTIEEDLSRRDLTINAIAMDPFTNEIIDPFNGKRDIKNKIIRLVGNPIKRILEDPIRIVRASRFLAAIDGTFDRNSFLAMRLYSKSLRNVAKERFRLEILKAMKTVPNSSKFFTALYNIKAMKYIFPEMNKSWNHTGGQYHAETLWEHMMDTGDQISVEKHLFKLAAYIHDIGKPLAYLLNSDGSFKKHEKLGVDIAQSSLKILKFSTEEIKFISDVIKYHMYSIKDITLRPRNVRRFLNKLESNKLSKEYDWKYFIEHHIVDKNANRKNSDFSKDEIDNFYDMFYKVINEKVPFSVKDLTMSGYEVMEYLQIGPGKDVGEVLQHLMEKVLENPEMNNNESLLDLTNKWMLNKQVEMINDVLHVEVKKDVNILK